MKEREYWYVYKHTSPSGKIYIGITGRTPIERWDSGHGYRNNKHFWRAIKKYGWNNITHEVLMEGLTKQKAEQVEKELIAKYESNNPKLGYNGDNGGRASGRFTEETKQILSKKAKERFRDISNHPTAKRVVCEDMIFNSAKECAEYYGVNYGTMKAWLNTRKAMPKEWYDRGLRYIDKQMSDYTIQGTKKVNRNTTGIKVICEEVIFDSIKECARFYNVSSTAMRDWLNGKYPIPRVWIDRGLRYLDESKNVNKTVQKGQNGDTCPHSKKIFCGGEIFSSIRACSKYYEENYSTMKHWLNGRNPMPQKYVELELRYATQEEIIEYNKNIKQSA